jgi:hypothetical protein
MSRKMDRSRSPRTLWLRMNNAMLITLLIATLATTADATPQLEPTFDGYALGMTVAQAEAVSPNRKSFECGKLMTSRCIVYARRLGQVAATVTVQFALDDRRINQIEIVPQDSGRYGGASCETAWSGLIAALSRTYGEPQSREGNTVRWRLADVTLTATVLQEENEFCDVAASLTADDRQ